MIQFHKSSKNQFTMIKLINIHRKIFYLKPQNIISIKTFLKPLGSGRSIIEINILNSDKEYVMYENIELFLKLMQDFKTESKWRYYEEMFIHPEPIIM